MAFNSGFVARPRTLAVVASLLLAASCSAPAGDDAGDDDVPDFGGAPPPGAGVAGAPGAVNTPSSNTPPGPAPTGAAGAPSEQTGSGGIGLDPAPSGGQNPGQNGQNSGQNVGTGGSSSTDPSAGAGGSNASPGGAGTPATPPNDDQQPPSDGPPPPAPSGDCNGAFFCDGFEGVAAGASPTPALWSLIDNYNPSVTQSANVQVSNANSHSGGQALRVLASDGRTGIIGTVPQTTYFVRVWLNVDSAPVGPVFIGLGTDQNSETRLRIQGQSFATINTVGPGDAVRPPNANGGGCPECVTLSTNRWFCAEMFIDNANQNATLWIDDVEAASIVGGALGWPVQPANPAVFLGSMSVQGGRTGVWIDDVVVGPTRIGCD